MSQSMAYESGMFMTPQTFGTVPCCKCGISMAPNAANMCVTCLRTEMDITEGLRKSVMLVHCPDCDRYFNPPSSWVKARWGTNELLPLCAKKLNLDKSLRLVDAEVIWTEPHSKQIKVKLKVQKEVLKEAILEQSYEVKCVQHDNMCDSCRRIQANPDQWEACVQLRQHVSHRRTFFYLEQLILKHDAAARAIRIKQMNSGIDFFFSSRSHAEKFKEFVGKVAPVKSRNDKKLVSHDTKSNNYNFRYTFSVEISPICREDLICLPPEVARRPGNLGPFVICTKVTDSIALLDPWTLRYDHLQADQYWKSPFKPLLSSRQLVEYSVLRVEPLNYEINVGSSKYALANVNVARVGRNDAIICVKTHLGHLLKTGDRALGYDLNAANLNDMELDKYKRLDIPGAVLIKKSYEEKRQRTRGKARPWKLRSLDMEVDESRGGMDQEKMELEYEQFLRDLEEDPELRFNLSLYHNKEYHPSAMASTMDVGEDVPSVPLEELIADLDLSDDEDQGDDMRE